MAEVYEGRKEVKGRKKEEISPLE